MRALTFDGSRAEVREVPDPEPAEGEALVRVALAGICNTDLEIVRGYMGFRGVLGHELLGVVESAPDPALVGARVTAEINVSCGACEACSRRAPDAPDGRHCPTRTVMGILGRDGCFADMLALPVRNLHRVPDGVPDEAAVFTEPLAAALSILEQVTVATHDRVLVLGDGKLGLLCASALASASARVTLAGRHADKMERVSGSGVRTVLADALAPGLFDIVVEATGSPAGLGLALERVRARGTLVLKSTFHGPTELPTAKIVIDEIRLVGSRCGLFPPALDALAARRIDPAQLISHTFSLSDGVDALEKAKAPGVLKVILRP